jgi:hypothetical protein
LYKECLIFICQEPGDIYRGDMQLRQAPTISQVEHKLPFYYNITEYEVPLITVQRLQIEISCKMFTTFDFVQYTVHCTVHCVGTISPAIGSRNQVGIGLTYRSASLCSLSTQFQTRFLESIPRPIAGLKIPTLYTYTVAVPKRDG